MNTCNAPHGPDRRGRGPRVDPRRVSMSRRSARLELDRRFLAVGMKSARLASSFVIVTAADVSTTIKRTGGLRTSAVSNWTRWASS